MIITFIAVLFALIGALPAAAKPETFDPFGLTCEGVSGDGRIIVNVTDLNIVLWAEAVSPSQASVHHESKLQQKVVFWPETNEFGHQVTGTGLRSRRRVPWYSLLWP